MADDQKTLDSGDLSFDISVIQDDTTNAMRRLADCQPAFANWKMHANLVSDLSWLLFGFNPNKKQYLGHPSGYEYQHEGMKSEAKALLEVYRMLKEVKAAPERHQTAMDAFIAFLLELSKGELVAAPLSAYAAAKGMPMVLTDGWACPTEMPGKVYWSIGRDALDGLKMLLGVPM